MDRGEYRQFLLPRNALSSLTVASFARTRLWRVKLRFLVSFPAALGSQGGSSDYGHSGRWRRLEYPGWCGTAYMPARPHTPVTGPLLTFPSCSCRKTALAGGSREAGLLAFPTCLKSGTPGDQVQCDLSLGQLPWSLRPEAVLSRGSGLQRDCSRHANIRSAQSQLGLLYPDPDDKGLSTPCFLYLF